MRILIYTHEFPPLAAGAGMFSADLAIGLASLGVEVHVVTPFWGPIKDWLSVNDTSLLRIHYMPLWKINEPKAALFFLLQLCLRYSFDFLIVTERGAQESIATQFYPFPPYLAVIHGSEILDYFGKKKPDLGIAKEAMAHFYSRARWR